MVYTPTAHVVFFQVRVWGNIVANVERLDDEIFKGLQVIDPHTNEYMVRACPKIVLQMLPRMSPSFSKNYN